uniref:Taste receptor type 1 member 3 n=1 Tax=Mola mola TaxID=94237 RepID=A0A3Q3WB43_MOLML
VALCFILFQGHWTESCLCSTPEWFQNISTSLFSLPGDIMLGGLFPINELTSNLNQYGLGLAIVMKYAVDEINAHQTLLPGITLGYEIHDTCRQSAVIVKPTISFLTAKSSKVLSVECNYTNYEPAISAVIGPRNSELVSVIGKLLGFFLMPQISFGATSDKFSDKLLYPSFFRTVPSDKWQVEVMVLLLLNFDWNWVAVVGSEEEYGQQGVQEFSKIAANKSVCVAYQGLIPVYTDPEPVVKTIIDNIIATNVEVVVVFSLPGQAQVFFKEVIRRKLRGVWIGSTSWAIHNQITSLPNIETIGTIIGFSDKIHTLDLLTAYTEELLSKLSAQNAHTSPPASTRSNLLNPCPECWNLSPANISMVTEPVLQRTAFSVYAAVYSVAQALHNLLGCNSTTCMQRSEIKIYPWKLLGALKNMSVDINGTHLVFDSDGNPNIGYNVVEWVWKDSGLVDFMEVGSFNKKLDINSSLFKWHTPNSQVPQSTCSAVCGKGQVRRVKGFHSCCFDCIDCLPGTYQATDEAIQCTACPQGQWSQERSTNCTEPTFDVLSWDTYEALVITLAAVLVVVCQGAVGVVFLKHRDTVCRLQLPLTSILQTVALSIITSISLQILFVSEFPQIAAPRLHILRGPASWLFLLICCALQAGICGWFVQEGPSLSEHLANMKINFVRSFLACPVLPLPGFAIMQSFITAMALVSFMCTFMAVKPLHQYNLARDITFSSLIYCVFWVTFIPVYLGLNDKYRSIVHISFTLASDFGLVAAYYFPKCYFLLRKPELNTADHFCTFLEGVPPTPAQEEPQTETESQQ